MANLVPDGGALYGVQLPIQTLTRTLVDPWEDDATVDDLATVARAAEAAGLDFVGVCDHVAIPDNEYAANMRTTWYDPVATLSWLGAQTERIHLLSVVWIAAYRHPLLTASAFGTLSHLTGGRAILGVGAGHVEAEFEALGVDYHRRGRLLDECIDAAFDGGIMPGWAYIGDPPDDLPPAWLTGGPEQVAESLREDRAVGANVFHLKFRGRSLTEYLDQLAAFGEQVRPLL